MKNKIQKKQIFLKQLTIKNYSKKYLNCMNDKKI